MAFIRFIIYSANFFAAIVFWTRTWQSVSSMSLKGILLERTSRRKLPKAKMSDLLRNPIWSYKKLTKMASVTCRTCLRCLACKVKITWELGIFLDPKKCCHVSHQNLEFLKCSPLEHSNATNPLAKCRLANIQILFSRRGTETRPFPKPRGEKKKCFSPWSFQKGNKKHKELFGYCPTG